MPLVAEGSIFADLQSIAMGESLGAGVESTVGGVGAGLIAGTSAVWFADVCRAIDAEAADDSAVGSRNGEAKCAGDVGRSVACSERRNRRSRRCSKSGSGSCQTCRRRCRKEVCRSRRSGGKAESKGYEDIE